MNKNVYIKLGRYILHVTFCNISPKLFNYFSKKYSYFYVNPERVNFHLKIVINNNIRYSAAEMMTINKIYNIKFPGAFGEINPDRNTGRFYARSSRRVLSILLRLVYGFYIKKLGGFMIHGSAIVYNGGAYIFYGNEGVGKSTIVKLSKQTLLADDVAIIIPRNNTYYSISMPFDVKGRVSAHMCYPLRKLIQISHDINQKDKITKNIDFDSYDNLINYLRPEISFYRKSPEYLFSLLIAVKYFTKSYSDFYYMTFSKTNKFIKLL